MVSVFIVVVTTLGALGLGWYITKLMPTVVMIPTNVEKIRSSTFPIPLFVINLPCVVIGQVIVHFLNCVSSSGSCLINIFWLNRECNFFYCFLYF